MGPLAYFVACWMQRERAGGWGAWGAHGCIQMLLLLQQQVRSRVAAEAAQPTLPACGPCAAACQDKTDKLFGIRILAGSRGKEGATVVGGACAAQAPDATGEDAVPTAGLCARRFMAALLHILPRQVDEVDAEQVGSWGLEKGILFWRRGAMR